MKLIIGFCIFLCSYQSFAQKPDESWQNILNLLSEKKWVEAEQGLQKHLQDFGNSEAALHNLASVHLEQQNYKLAYAAWRKLLHYYPRSQEARQGISYLESIDGPTFQYNSSFQVRDLYRGPFYLSLVVVWIFLFLFLRNLTQALRANRQREEPKPLPLIIYVFFALFVGSSVFSVLHYQNQSANYALSLETQKAFLSPSAESPQVLEVPWAKEVRVVASQNEWLQIEDERGQRAWVEKAKIYSF